jgi:hypothetical protein
MTQFSVSVIGSLQNGYTATAEKVISNSAHLSNEPMKAMSAAIEIKAPVPAPVPAPKLSQANLKREMESQKLRRGAVRSAVKMAADKAEIAAREMYHMLKALPISTEINSNAANASEKAKTAAEAAVTAAEVAVNAMKNAEETLKVGIANNETKALVNNKTKKEVWNGLNMIRKAESIMGDVLNISKVAETEVKKAIDELNKIEKGTILTRYTQYPVIVAKNATEKARNIWTHIYNRLNGMSGGRKYTQRKRKHQKRYTAHK